MDLLIASNTVTLDQADKAPASGTPGWATDGDPATGQLATDAPAWHYNMMMSELIAIIKAAGITPSNADWSQVLKAMQTIFSPAQYGVAPYSASLAQLVGGYPKGAIVFDASGNYWQSTAEKNVTVPGAENATWVNFFEGVMTQQQGDIRYLQLSGGNVTGPMDWGSKTAAATLTHRYWSAGSPAEGDATPDATLTIAGGTPGTANKGTMALSTGTLDLSETGEVLAPDATEFDGKQVVNAGSAEGRYVKSVPATGQTRITDLVENSDGNLLLTDSNGSLITINPVNQGIYPDGTLWREIGAYREIWFSLTLTKTGFSSTYTYPVAFSEKPFAILTAYDAGGTNHVGFSDPASGFPTATQIQAVGMGASSGASPVFLAVGSVINFYLRGRI